MQIKKVKRVRVYEEVLEQLKEALIQGELKPGDRFPTERELVEKFNVSRVTIRQALTVLEALGLIERKVGGGTYAINNSNDFEVARLVEVLSSKKSTITEPLEVRRILEPEIARLAAKRATTKDITEMEDCLKRQKVKVEANELIIQEDSEFHYAIAKSTKNSIVLKIIEMMHEMLWDTRKSSISAYQGSKRSLDGHYLILKAIKNRDGDAAYETMSKHLEEVETLIISYLEAQQGKTH